jgi:hypothetical protein
MINHEKSDPMRLHRLIITALLLLGYVLVCFFYLRGVVTPRQFFFASFMAMLAFLTIFYLSKPPNKGVEFARLRNNKALLVLLPYSIFTLAFIELLFQGHSGLLTIFSLISILSLLVFSRNTFLAVATTITTLALLISAFYGFYIPNFGVDTWRDSIQAVQIIENGGLKDLTIVHKAYPFPLVSILYAIVAMIMGLDPLWASSLMGLLYLLLLPLWVFVVARHARIPYPHLSILLVFTIPHVVMWSTSFIPQAYAILSSLPLLFLNFNAIVALLLSISVVMGHGGLALFTLIFLIYSFFIQSLFGKQAQSTKTVKTKIIVFALLFALYVTYVIASAVLRGVSNVVSVIYSLLAGPASSAQASTAVGGVYLWNLIADIAPYIILLLLGFIIIADFGDIVLSSYALLAMAGLSIAIFSQTYVSGLDLIRYVGMESSVILAIISPKSLSALIRRGHMGTVYAAGIVFATIVSFGFGGVLMPGSPYVSTFYTGTFSSGSLTRVEALELSKLAPILTSGIDYITDLKAGLYLGYNYIWVEFKGTALFIPEQGIKISLSGSYFTVTPDYLEHFNGLLIFRKNGLHIMKTYHPDIPSYLENRVNQLSLVYRGKNTDIIYFTNK